MAAVTRLPGWDAPQPRAVEAARPRRYTGGRVPKRFTAETLDLRSHPASRYPPLRLPALGCHRHSVFMNGGHQAGLWGL